MANFFDILDVSARMVDTRLEGTDESTLLITVKNVSRFLTATNVSTTISVAGGPIDGLKITPDDRFFGTIPPRKSVTKEISILTERVEPQDAAICYHLNFNASFDKCEGDTTTFTISDD